jgi:hypothetical protein
MEEDLETILMNRFQPYNDFTQLIEKRIKIDISRLNWLKKSPEQMKMILMTVM